MKEACRKIRLVRKLKGLRQEEFAELIGVHRVTLAKYETKPDSLTLDAIRSVARATNRPLAWFFLEPGQEINESGQDLLTEEGALDLIQQGLDFLKAKKAATPRDGGFRTTQPDRAEQWAKSPPDEPSATGNP